MGRGPGTARGPAARATRNSVLVRVVGELDEAEAMAERVAEAHTARAAPVHVTRLLLGARRDGSRGCLIHVVDDQVEMHRSPVAMVVAQGGRRLHRPRTRRLLQ